MWCCSSPFFADHSIPWPLFRVCSRLLFIYPPPLFMPVARRKPMAPLTSLRNNRYSMPVTSYKRESTPDLMGLGHINTTGFLFGDDDDKFASQKETVTSPDVKSHLQVTSDDDKFPILIRDSLFPGTVSLWACSGF